MRAWATTGTKRIEHMQYRCENIDVPASSDRFSARHCAKLNARCTGRESILNPGLSSPQFLRTLYIPHGQLTCDGCNVCRRPALSPRVWSPERKTLPKSRSMPRRFPHLRGFLLPAIWRLSSTASALGVERSTAAVMAVAPFTSRPRPRTNGRRGRGRADRSASAPVRAKRSRNPAPAYPGRRAWSAARLRKWRTADRGWMSSSA